MVEDMLHNRSTITLLEKLGLSRNEVKCYLAALELGLAKVSDIAKTARIHRVNVYDALKTLIEKGLVEQELTSQGKKVRPSPLERLEELALDYQKGATKLRWKVADLLPKLLAVSHQAQEKSVVMGDVMLFRGEDAFYRIAERTLSVPAGSIVTFIDPYDDLFRPPDNPEYDDVYYIPERLKRGIFARVLHRVNQRGRLLNKNDAKQMRETRFLPPDVTFPCMIMIYGDEVAFLWKKEHIMGVVVHKNPIVDLMRFMFQLLWTQAGVK